MAGEEITIDERRKYLKKTQPRYHAADRAGRGALLTEMAAVAERFAFRDYAFDPLGTDQSKTCVMLLSPIKAGDFNDALLMRNQNDPAAD